MAIIGREQLKKWFLRGMKPLASQFADWIDSYWHKNEKIPMTAVENLTQVINEKANKPELDAEIINRTEEDEILQQQIYNLQKITSVRGSVETEEKLQELDNKDIKVGDSYIVTTDENYDKKSTIYIWDGSDWLYHSSFSGDNKECENFANTNLIFDKDREHDLNNNYLAIGNLENNAYGEDWFRQNLYLSNSNFQINVNGYIDLTSGQNINIKSNHINIGSNSLDLCSNIRFCDWMNSEKFLHTNENCELEFLTAGQFKEKLSKVIHIQEQSVPSQIDFLDCQKYTISAYNGGNIALVNMPKGVEVVIAIDLVYDSTITFYTAGIPMPTLGKIEKAGKHTVTAIDLGNGFTRLNIASYE